MQEAWKTDDWIVEVKQGISIAIFVRVFTVSEVPLTKKQKCVQLWVEMFWERRENKWEKSLLTMIQMAVEMDKSFPVNSFFEEKI